MPVEKPMSWKDALLYSLNRISGISQDSIALSLNTSQSTVTRRVRNFEERLAARNPAARALIEEVKMFPKEEVWKMADRIFGTSNCAV